MNSKTYDSIHNLITIHLGASAPCSTESVIAWCQYQSNAPTTQIQRVFNSMIQKGQVIVWDNTPDAYELRHR